MTSGQWAAIVVMLPLLAAILSFIGGRALLLSLATMIGVLISVSKLAMLVWANGPQYYTVSGWAAPLGIEWYADGLSVLMLLMTALVNSCIIWYALKYFKHFSPPLPKENLKKNAGKPVTSNHLLPFRYYLPIWLLLWSGLNALFLSADLFNLYITLEIITLAAVPLIILSGSVIALRAGMRYLLISITASMFYLLGIALLYGAVGTLDIASLAKEIDSGSTIFVAMLLIILGLIIKTALFPFHFWLPATYSYAPAPVSALLSALVIKSTFYLLLRLWFEIFPKDMMPPQLFGILGTIAIVWGSWQALQQQHLKPLIAYLTVAQVGYFFILFPLASGITDSWSVVAFQGGIYLTLSHAFATAALFMVAGNIQHILGTDNLNTMHGFGRRYPLTLIALAIAGVSIIGLPPSGGFLGNWLLLKATYASGQWWWAIIIVLGGLLAIAYMWKVLRYTLDLKFTLAEHPHVLPITMKLAPLLLAMMALILGTFATPLLNLLEIGAPF